MNFALLYEAQAFAMLAPTQELKEGPWVSCLPLRATAHFWSEGSGLTGLYGPSCATTLTTRVKAFTVPPAPAQGGFACGPIPSSSPLGGVAHDTSSLQGLVGAACLSLGFPGMNTCLWACRLVLVAFGRPRLRNMGARQGRVGGGLQILGRAHWRESFPGVSAQVTTPFRGGSGREGDSVCSPGRSM